MLYRRMKQWKDVKRDGAQFGYQRSDVSTKRWMDIVWYKRQIDGFVIRHKICSANFILKCCNEYLLRFSVEKRKCYTHTHWQMTCCQNECPNGSVFWLFSCRPLIRSSSQTEERSPAGWVECVCVWIIRWKVCVVHLLRHLQGARSLQQAVWSMYDSVSVYCSHFCPQTCTTTWHQTHVSLITWRISSEKN